MLEAKLEKLENYKQSLLARVELSGQVDSEAEHFFPGLHFCPEWDEMAIHMDSPEWESCICDIKKKK